MSKLDFVFWKENLTKKGRKTNFYMKTSEVHMEHINQIIYINTSLT